MRPFGPDEMALLEAIHADPLNDTPRLQYADWLSANGDPEYGDFIRLQCQPMYIGIFNRNPKEPRVSINWEFPYHEKNARKRLNRMLELLPPLYGTERFAELAKLRYCEDFYRGLSVLQVQVKDHHLPLNDWFGQWLANPPPLVRLWPELTTKRLREWLSHPMMKRVDRLQIWPDVPSEAEPDANSTMNSYYDAFWAENMPILAACPLLDRLEEVQPCGCRSTMELTENSIQNMKLCEKLIEPRVYVDYSY